ncbi:MAG TPA: cyclic dehypoxanthinyl futalosine synthase [Nitrososphaeraceae archaeon]|nr:cyclic dehypoxanthinyl futalosine synthase [Nitrososphaeraceae archaeon]
MQNRLLVQNLISQSDVADILDRALCSQHLKLNECIRLIKSDDSYSIGLVGSLLRQRLYGNTATFVNNIILNYTNVCITYCKFCAFYRPPGHEQSYTLSLDEIVRRVTISRDAFGITQVLIQGGHNPNLKIEYYEEAFKTIKEKCPEVGIHGLSASEIDMIARVEKSSIKEILSRLKAAGLDSLPGAGAEILDDNVKAEISPFKIKSHEWIRIMELAHEIGLKSSATMMYGTVETEEQRAQHIMKIAQLQEKTRGFMAFIPWSFEPNKTQIQSEGLIKYPPGGLQLLKMISIARIIYYGLIDHIQSSWLTNGIGMAQLALNYGADDFGGTLIGEEVVSATGARSTELTAHKIISAIKQIGFKVVERDNLYRTIKYY